MMASSSLPADSVAAAAVAHAAAEENFAARHVSAVFEKFEREHYECQELLSQMNTHWMLSSDEQRAASGSGSAATSADPTPGLISRMAAVQDTRVVLLVPADGDEGSFGALDMREVHQVVRELAYGIYAFNQLPGVSLEPNDDVTSTCQMSPIYHDTRVGRLLTDVDATLKSLWHGVWFPRERRIKFNERWHSVIEPNRNNNNETAANDKETRNQMLVEFVTAGMVDASEDSDYRHVYDEILSDSPSGLLGLDMAVVMETERRYFMSRVEDIVLRLILYQDSVAQYNNLFVVNSSWSVTSAVRDFDPDIGQAYERLNARLQQQCNALRCHLCDKPAVRQQLDTLRLVAFLTVLLVSMRRRMKVPDIGRMLPNMTGEETRTERDLPPLVVGDDFKCTNFNYPSGTCFQLHGGVLFDYETPDPILPSQSIIDAYDAIVDEASSFSTKYVDTATPYQESYPAPVKVLDGKRYFLVPLDFETYYPQVPQRPRWVHAMCDEVTKLRPKRLPISESQIHEQFKKYFGYKRAIKLRNLPQGLRMAAQRGLVAMFATLSRKSPVSRLGKHDEAGLTLMHHAAIHNRPHIITMLVHLGQDINVRKISSVFAAGPTPLHLAVRCGSLDTVSCLLASGANVLLPDERGWAPVHHAAYYDQERILRMLIRRNETTTELFTKNELKSTPLLLAASSGALMTLKCLIDLGAYILRTDENGNNAVHLAALHYHANILEFFIGWNHPEVDVWQTLIGMIKHNDVARKDAAVRCLEVLTTTKPSYWKPVLEAGGIGIITELLKETADDTTSQVQRLHAIAVAVLCNISEQPLIRHALAAGGSIPVLVRFLGFSTSSPESFDVASRAAIVVADLADAGDDNRRAIADSGGIEALVGMLESNLEDILANSINALRVLCDGSDDEIRTAVGNTPGAVPALVEFLSVSSEILQAGSAAAIAAMSYHHRDNQNAFVAEGVVKPLVNLIKGHIIKVQVKAALALEVLADHNEESQSCFLQHDGAKALIRLLKMFSMEVKERAALALWSLAGQTKSQQRFIAEMISIPMLIEILLRDSDKLQYVGCMAMMALGREDAEGQLRVAQQGGIQPLVRLLRLHKTLPHVMLAVIRALASLCIGIAFRPNKVLQTRIAEENAILTLVPILVSSSSEEMRVEVAYTLACIVLCHPENLEQLQAEESFSFDIVRSLLSSPLESVRLRAGFALAIFAFNNTPQQFAIRQAGGLGLSCFESFLSSCDELERATAAFQIVVLARVIIDADSVELTAQGITTLVNILTSSNDTAIVHAAGLLSSLAHTRAGIPDAMVAVGVLPLLVDRLSNDCSEPVRHACAVTLGYLTYNRTAARLLLAACRNTPGLYDRLMTNIGQGARINENFVADFEFARAIGLPCMSLEIHGGPPVMTQKCAKRLNFSRNLKSPNHPSSASSTGLMRASSAPTFSYSLVQRPHSSLRPSTSRAYGRPRTASKVDQRRSDDRPAPVVRSATMIHLSSTVQTDTLKCPDSSAFKTRVQSWQK